MHFVFAATRVYVCGNVGEFYSHSCEDRVKDGYLYCNGKRDQNKLGGIEK